MHERSECTWAFECEDFVLENIKYSGKNKRTMGQKRQEKRTNAFEAVTETILKKHKATPKEHNQILTKIDSFMHDLRLALQKEKIDAYVMLGGSAAKGTFLKHDFDCDVFVRFQYDAYKDQTISEILEKVLRKVPTLHYERVHGSRDYFQGVWKGLPYEIIPVLSITANAQAKNITDMSPLHVEWLNQHLTEELRDQILLTKLFFKAQKVYGAESYMHGFSGHVVDLLTIYYGSFRSLLENIVQWQEKDVINLTPHPVNLNALNPDKLQSAIILIDPVQPGRNAAAAVGFDQFYQIKNQAAAFLENPTFSFFERKNIGRKDLLQKKQAALKQKGMFLVLQAQLLHGKLDTIGTKILKAFEFLQQEFTRNDFTVLDSGWDWAEEQDQPALLWFAVQEKKLSPTKEHLGPPLKLQKDVAAFRAKHKKTYFQKERICATVPRKFTTPDALLRDMLKQQFMKEKAKKWRVVKL